MTRKPRNDTLEPVGTAIARLEYDGPSLRDSSMDVRQLAPALLKLGQYCETANAVLNGDDAKISVHILADFEGGSFDIVYKVLQSLKSRARGLFGAERVVGADQMLEVLGLGGGNKVNVLSVLKARGGRPISPRERRTVLQDGSIRVEDLNLPPHVAKLCEDPGVLLKAMGFLEPIMEPGIDIVRSVNASTGEVIEEFNKDNVEEIEGGLQIYEEFEEGRPLTDSTSEFPLEIVNVPLSRPSRVWTFSAGGQTYRARITDQEYLELHNVGEAHYAIGAILLVRMRTRAWRTARGISVKHEIVKVL